MQSKVLSVLSALMLRSPKKKKKKMTVEEKEPEAKSLKVIK
jgi:hypothetical protein